MMLVSNFSHAASCHESSPVCCLHQFAAYESSHSVYRPTALHIQACRACCFCLSGPAAVSAEMIASLLGMLLLQVTKIDLQRVRNVKSIMNKLMGRVGRIKQVKLLLFTASRQATAFCWPPQTPHHIIVFSDSLHDDSCTSLVSTIGTSTSRSRKPQCQACLHSHAALLCKAVAFGRMFHLHCQ